MAGKPEKARDLFAEVDDTVKRLNDATDRLVRATGAPPARTAAAPAPAKSEPPDRRTGAKVADSRSITPGEAGYTAASIEVLEGAGRRLRHRARPREEPGPPPLRLASGRWYLDMFSCFATLPVGINHPKMQRPGVPREAARARRS